MSEDDNPFRNLALNPATWTGRVGRIMRVLERISKHLPVDDWLFDPPVDTDVTLVVLKGHLLIETELIDICYRLLKNPHALEGERLRFSLRLKLVQALVGSEELPDEFWQAIKDLNAIRNKLAHRLEPNDLDTAIQQFVKRFDTLVLEGLIPGKSISQRLICCITILCQVLSDIGAE
jgi:hypothetical protein